MNIFEKWKFKNLLNQLTISKLDALSGIEFEEFIYELFEYWGYKTSLTRASGDNGIDVIAKSKQYSIGIQAKLYYNHNVNNKAIQEVFSGKNFYNLDIAIVITNWKLSNPAITLAKSLNVIIIDRPILTAILKNSRKENIAIIKNLIKQSLGA